MTRKKIAELVFECLHSPPREASVRRLSTLRSSDVRRLLLHLDQTGLAIYLLHHLLEHTLYSSVSPELQSALHERLERNQARTEDMFQEFSSVILALESAKVRYAVLKGFSLVPDYCPAICIRHQTDFDLLVDQSSLQTTRDTLQRLGYLLESVDPTGETKFVRQLGRPFPGMEDIYAPQSARHIEVHEHFWERRFQVVLDFDRNVLSRRRFKTLRETTFPVLAEEDIFVGQLLHAFRHFLKGWIRAAWMFEIASYVRTHFDDHALWGSVGSSVVSDETANACGLMLLLCQQVLGMAIPVELEERFTKFLLPQLRRWVELFGKTWAASDMSGSKLNLMIHEYFVSDRGGWSKEHSSLLLPRRTPSVRLETRERGEAVRSWRMRQLKVFARRAAFHVSRNAEYALHSIRWHHALLEL